VDHGPDHLCKRWIYDPVKGINSPDVQHIETSSPHVSVYGKSAGRCAADSGETVMMAKTACSVCYRAFSHGSWQKLICSLFIKAITHFSKKRDIPARWKPNKTSSVGYQTEGVRLCRRKHQLQRDWRRSRMV
jgi:hypothetical protein